MTKKPILVEKANGGWGVALGANGRFYRVRVPKGLRLGDDLPKDRWAKPIAVAAIITLFLLGCTAAPFIMAGLGAPSSESISYATVVLKFERPTVEKSISPAPEPVQPEQAAAPEAVPDPSANDEELVVQSGEEEICMTLSVDREGMVSAVRPQEPSTKELVGMQVEQAITKTYNQVSPEGQGGVLLTPDPRSSDTETKALVARIKTALSGGNQRLDIVPAEAVSNDGAQPGKTPLRGLLQRLSAGLGNGNKEQDNSNEIKNSENKNNEVGNNENKNNEDGNNKGKKDWTQGGDKQDKGGTSENNLSSNDQTKHDQGNSQDNKTDKEKKGQDNKKDK